MSNSPAPRLRLDRSRPFSTIHGERAPGDPHQLAQSLQDGIHFDSHGLHIDELIGDDPKLRALVDRKLKRQIKASAPEAEGSDADDADDGADDTGKTGGDNGGDVNLEAWLRGEANYPWFQITKTVRERHSQNITKMFDMLEFLVGDLKIVPESELKPEFAEQLKPKQD